MLTPLSSLPVQLHINSVSVLYFPAQCLSLNTLLSAFTSFYSCLHFGWIKTFQKSVWISPCLLINHWLSPLYSWPFTCQGHWFKLWWSSGPKRVMMRAAMSAFHWGCHWHELLILDEQQFTAQLNHRSCTLHRQKDKTLCLSMELNNR